MNNLQHTIKIVVSETGLTTENFLNQNIWLINNHGVFSYGISLSGMFGKYLS